MFKKKTSLKPERVEVDSDLVEKFLKYKTTMKLDGGMISVMQNMVMIVSEDRRLLERLLHMNGPEQTMKTLSAITKNTRIMTEKFGVGKEGISKVSLEDLIGKGGF